MRLVVIERNGQPAEPALDLTVPALELCCTYARRYAASGFAAPWTGYLALSGPACIGGCGFIAPPADDRVEITCFTFPGYEGLGFATQMARTLVDIALLADPALVIAAQTPADGASPAILRKLGFAQVAAAHGAQERLAWEWRLPAHVGMQQRQRARV